MTRHRARRVRRGLMVFALVGLLGPGRAVADPPGLALVIGIDRDASLAGEGVCGPAARRVRDRLSEQGLAVEAVLNPSAVAVRSAIDGFAEQIEKTPPGAALVYVCGTAISAADHLFLLPSDTGPQERIDPARQAIVLQALLNALAGTGGTLYADLALAVPVSGKAASEAGKRLPAGLHLALSLTQRDGAARIGERLASSGFRAGQDWDAAAAMLQAGTDSPDGAVQTLLPPASSVSASASPPQGASSRTLPEPADAMLPSGATAPVAPPRPPDEPAQPDAASRATLIPPEPARSQPEASQNPPARGRGTEASKKASGVIGSKNEPLDSDRIKRLQAALARNGYGGPIDGRLNWAVLVAIRVFQHSLGNPETGVLTQDELVHLLNR